MSVLSTNSQKASGAGLPLLLIGGCAVMAHGFVRDTEDLVKLITLNGLNLNEPALRATVLKHGNQELYEKLQHACAAE
jgi:hypothetical protein